MSHGMRPVPAARRVFLLLSMVAVLDPATSRAGPPSLTDDRLGIRSAPLLLLNRPDVRAEVGLDAAQAADADRALNELYVQATALRGMHGPQYVDRKRAIDESEEQWLQTKLSASQRKRLTQIDLQWEGASALIGRPVIADRFGLTAEQRARLTEAIAIRDRRRAEGANPWECERQLFEQTRALLTTEQKQRWRAMLGPPFAFVRQPADPKVPAPH